MAALDATQVRQVFTDHPGARTRSLFEVRGVSGGDTVDLGPDGLGFYRNVLQGVWLCVTNPGSGQAQISGSVVSAPSALSNDGAYLLVDGVPV